MSRPRTVAEGWVPKRHGTPSTYNRGCRCDSCRAAHAERIRVGGANERHRRRNYAARELVNGRLVSTAPQITHGSRETYNRFGCRCIPCTEANSMFVAERRRKGRAA